MEIIALMAKARDEWFADGTTQRVNLAFSIQQLLEYEKTNSRSRGQTR
jgi:hypothetical protein